MYLRYMKFLPKIHTMMFIRMRKFKGIEPIVAIVLLIVVVTIIVVLFYTWLSKYITRTTTTITKPEEVEKIVIVNVQIVDKGLPTETLRVYIQNIGDKVVEVNELQIIDSATKSTICYCLGIGCRYEVVGASKIEIKPKEVKYIEFQPLTWQSECKPYLRPNRDYVVKVVTTKGASAEQNFRLTSG